MDEVVDKDLFEVRNGDGVAELGSPCPESTSDARCTETHIRPFLLSSGVSGSGETR